MVEITTLYRFLIDWEALIISEGDYRRIDLHLTYDISVHYDDAH